MSDVHRLVFGAVTALVVYLFVFPSVFNNVTAFRLVRDGDAQDDPARALEKLEHASRIASEAQLKKYATMDAEAARYLVSFGMHSRQHMGAGESFIVSLNMLRGPLGETVERIFDFVRYRNLPGEVYESYRAKNIWYSIGRVLVTGAAIAAWFVTRAPDLKT
jgi:hypothetical protein